MARRDDIPAAFAASLKIDGKGARTVTTVDFVRNLEALNHDFGLAEANRWIKFYRSNFRDVSTEEGERRTWQQYNPNRGGIY